MRKSAGKSPNGQQRTDSTGVSPQLTVCQSRPHCLRRIGYRSDCDWTGVPLFSLWVMAESGAARYFESAFIALCLSAGHGVPLHTLMLITITKRKYLANGYSVVKELPNLRHTKENWVRVFVLSPSSPWETSNFPSIQKTFLFFL